MSTCGKGDANPGSLSFGWLPKEKAAQNKAKNMEHEDIRTKVREYPCQTKQAQGATRSLVGLRVDTPNQDNRSNASSASSVTKRKSEAHLSVIMRGVAQ
jgi:hypothetical protein